MPDPRILSGAELARWARWWLAHRVQGETIPVQILRGDVDNLLHSLHVAREALREIADDKECAGEYIRRKARRALGEGE